MLLVHHRQTQAVEDNIVLNHRVGAHHQLGLPVGHQLQHLLAALALAAATEPGDGQAQRLQPANELAEMLLGQDLGGRHQRTLPTAVDGHGGGQRSHHRFARSHVALQQAVHGLCSSHVESYFSHHALLGLRQVKR